MALARYDSRRNFGLRKPVPLNLFDDVRPVHEHDYRPYDLESKRPYDIYFSHNLGMDTFAERVRQARKDLKLTQKQLSKQSGLAQATLSDIERGKNEGSRDVVALAKALGVSAEWLINGEQSGDTDAVVAEFAALYRQVTDEGRDYLRKNMVAARIMFMEAQATPRLSITQDRRKLVQNKD